MQTPVKADSALMHKIGLDAGVAFFANRPSNDRGGVINLSQQLDLCRTVLLGSKSISMELIWSKNCWRYGEGQNPDVTPRIDERSESEKPAPEGADLPSGENDSPLAKKFGHDLADALLRHYGRRTRTTSRLEA